LAKAGESTLRIIQGASQLFFERGYSKVTMEEIAEQVGVTKKTIYNHFPNKLALLNEVVEQEVDTIVNDLDVIAHHPSHNFLEKLEHFVDYLFREFNSQKRALFEDFSKYTTPSLQKRISPQIRKKIIQLTEELVEEGIREQLVRQDVSRDILPYLYITMVEGLSELYNDEEVPFSPGELLREGINITYEGIRARDKGKDAKTGMEGTHGQR
jgi:AcrR family transcriptional regulator